MIKTLKTLSKVTRRELDTKRRDLNVLLEKKDSLFLEKEQLRLKLIKEMEISAKSFEAQYAYAAYSKRVELKQGELDKFVSGLDKMIDNMSEEIANAFAELKKYEILLEKKEKELEEELLHKEQIMLNEIGMINHERKKKTG